jgi:hypothetical protein
LTRAQIGILLKFGFIGVVALTVFPERATAQPDSFNPRASHSTGVEKAIIVPDYVVRRWKAIKLAVIDKSRGTENIYTVPVGIQHRLPSTSLTIMVDAFLPAFVMEGMTITTSSNDPINPAAKVRISDNGTLVFQGWLFAKFPNTHAVTHPKYGISLIGVIPAGK